MLGQILKGERKGRIQGENLDVKRYMELMDLVENFAKEYSNK